MFEALLISSAFTVGFAAAWALGGKTREHLAETKARSQEQARAAAEKLELATTAKSELTNAFKALSAEALSNTSQSFLQLANTTMEKFQERAQGDLAMREQAVHSLVQPIRESLAHVDGKLGELERTRVHAYSALNEQLRGLVETHLPMLHSETANLVKALRQPTVRGRWGEMQLKRVVEMAGMLEHCDFVEQQNATTEDGRVRPDLIVHLPGGRQMVIDAKTPLAAYLDAHEAEDDAAHDAHLKRHAQLVRSHMTALGRKGYWDAFDPSPDFVILFLPGEMLFSAALEADPALIEAGANERVLLATPTTLITMLRMVAIVWREEAVARNAEEVAQLGRDLYERIGKLGEHWSDVGDKLGKAVGAYNKSVGTLETRVLVTARKFEELKAAPEGGEIQAPQPVDVLLRAVQAPELVGPRAVEAVSERVARIG